MSDVMFDSMNQYFDMIVISDRTAEGLAQQLREIKRPFKINFMTTTNNRHHAYITGGHQIVKKVKSKSSLKGNSNDDSSRKI